MDDNISVWPINSKNYGISGFSSVISRFLLLGFWFERSVARASRDLFPHLLPKPDLPGIRCREIICLEATFAFSPPHRARTRDYPPHRNGQLVFGPRFPHGTAPYRARIAVRVADVASQIQGGISSLHQFVSASMRVRAAILPLLRASPCNNRCSCRALSISLGQASVVNLARAYFITAT